VMLSTMHRVSEALYGSAWVQPMSNIVGTLISLR
jgi:hypothetical protein